MPSRGNLARITATLLARHPGRITIAVTAFAALAIEGLPTAMSRPQLILAGVVTILVSSALIVRRREGSAAILLIGASLLLRIMWFDVGPTDQILVSQAAWDRVMAGGSPYGAGYAETIPPGAPFPYGPLALVWWSPGAAVELVAASAVLALLWWQRAWLTIAVFGAISLSVHLNTMGVNDYSPALLLLLSMIAFRSRPLLGASLLAVTAALKPYAVAWFLPAIGYGGMGVAAALVGISAVLWSPLFLWWGGPAAFARTVELAAAAHPTSQMSLNVPFLRWVAVPFALLGLFARQWEAMVILGSATFATFLFLDFWASASYWLALIPVVGLVLERGQLWPLPKRPDPLEDAVRDHTTTVPNGRLHEWSAMRPNDDPGAAGVR